MASTDARPIPIKNTAYRVTFPILDADGDLVPNAATLTNVLIRDAAVVTSAAGAITQIGTSGMYYLDLTAAEMNADTVAIIINTTTSGAKSTPIVLYPQEMGDIKVDMQSMAAGDGTSVTNLSKTTRAIGRGQCAGGGSTTSIPTVSFTPPGAALGQFIGRIITFDADTPTTAALRGQSTDITGSTNAANPTFTVTALTSIPGAGDTFSVT